MADKKPADTLGKSGQAVLGVDKAAPDTPEKTTEPKRSPEYQ